MINEAGVWQRCFFVEYKGASECVLECEGTQRVVSQAMMIDFDAALSGTKVPTPERKSRCSRSQPMRKAKVARRVAERVKSCKQDVKLCELETRVP